MAEGELNSISPTIAELAKITNERLQFWSRLPGWTVSEQAALLLELDPSHIRKDNQSNEYKDLRFMLKRAKVMRKLLSPAKPLTIIEWADELGVKVPKDLRIAVSGREKQKNWKLKYFNLKKSHKYTSDENFNPKTRKSLEIMILLMASDSYGYTFNKNNNAAKRIVDIPANGKKLIGIDAIRIRLREASEEYANDFQIFMD